MRVSLCLREPPYEGRQNFMARSFHGSLQHKSIFAGKLLLMKTGLHIPHTEHGGPGVSVANLLTLDSHERKARIEHTWK